MDNNISEDKEDHESWISWYCTLDGNEFFCEISKDFLNDHFALFGLKNQIQNGYFDLALKMILGAAPSDAEIESADFLDIFQHADVLYGLAHARFILTADGLGQMKDKYLDDDFGCCPRVMCESWPLLPIGLVEGKYSEVKGYCGKCQEVYELENDDLDDQNNPSMEPGEENEHSQRTMTNGQAFGSSFAPFFYLTFPSLAPKEAARVFEPRIYGFRIYNQCSKTTRKALDGHFGNFYRDVIRTRASIRPS